MWEVLADLRHLDAGFGAEVRTEPRDGPLAGRDVGAVPEELVRAVVGRAVDLREPGVLADVVRDYGPDDWDRVFGVASAMQPDPGEGRAGWLDALRAGPAALKLFGQYQYGKFQVRDGGYCQIREDDYSV